MITLKLRLKCFWLRLELIVLRLKRFQLTLHESWLRLQLWWWSREMPIADVKIDNPHYHCCHEDCIQDIEPLE